MGSPRNREHKGLPTRWRWKEGAYRFRVPPGQEHLWDGKKEFRLGKTLSESHITYAGRIASVDGAIQTIGQLIDRYLIEVTPTKASSTQRTEIEDLRKIREMIGHNPIASFAPHDAYQMRDKIYRNIGKGSGERKTNRVMGTVKTLFTKAIEWGAVREHPMTENKFKMLSVPKKHQMRVAASIQDVLDATEFCPQWLDNYVRLKLLTGLRQVDMLLLTRHCITDEGLLVTPSKTKNSSGVKTLYEWTPELRKVVADIVSLPPTSVYLFKTQKGEPLIKNKATNSAFNSAWQRWMKRLKDRNIPRFSERSIRNLVGSEGGLQEASERLGHASPATTKRYYRLKPTVVTPLSSH